MKKVYGIDINPIFKVAADEFASEKKINADFKIGIGEKLPYKDNFFDFVVSTDTFEHVQNLKITMDECYRVLKPGGSLLAVFPQFLHRWRLLTSYGKIYRIHLQFDCFFMTAFGLRTNKFKGVDIFWFFRYLLY